MVQQNIDGRGFPKFQKKLQELERKLGVQIAKDLQDRRVEITGPLIER